MLNSNKTFFVLRCLFLCVPFSAQALEPNFAAIQAAISAGHIHSKAELLAALPAECRKYYALVYASRATRCSSFEAPRVVTTCSAPTSGVRFLLALEGESGDPHDDCDGADFFEVSPQTGALHSAEIHFRGAKPQLIDNPERCTACHGEPLKLMADQFPNWPGFYESTLGNLSLGSDEEKGYRRYQRRRATDPLYRQLELWDEVPGDADPTAFLSFRIKAETTRFNETFFNALGKLNDRRIAVSLISSPHFPKFRFALAGAVLGCKNIDAFFPSVLQAAGVKSTKVRGEMRSHAMGENQRTYAKIQSVNTDIQPGETLSRENLERASELVYVARRMGIDDHSFSTTLARGELAFPALGFTPLESLLLGAGPLPGEIATSDLKSLRRLLADRRASLIPLAGRLWASSTETCDVLRQSSLRALAGVAPVVPVPPQRKSLPGFAFHECIECHTNRTSPNLETPRMPFAPDAEIEPWMRANADALPKLRFRVNDPTDLRMPPNRALSDDERKALNTLLDTMGAPPYST